MKIRDSKEEYEEVWRQLSAWVEECVVQGVTDPGEIVQHITLRESSTHPDTARLGHYGGARDGEILSVQDGQYCLRPVSAQPPEIAQKLAAYVREHDITTVVELGAGTGRNLFALRKILGKQPLQMHACEYTQAGRQVCARIAQIGRIPNFDVHAFDYRTPDLSFLQGDDRVLFFSVHSVEQVAEIPDRLIEEMLTRTSSCVALHFEPVGWQADPALLQWRERTERSIPLANRISWKARRALEMVLRTQLARGFIEIPLSEVRMGDAQKISLNAARWSAARGYNKNFLRLLERAHERREIEFLERHINAFGGNPFNPSTVIAWKKSGPQAAARG